MEGVLNSIVGKAQSDLLLFMVLITIVLILVAKPLYKQVTDYLTLKEQQKITRESMLIEVIKGNSSVMAEIKTLLTSNNDNCRGCKTEQLAYFKRFDDKQDASALVLHDIEANIDTIAQNIAGITGKK